MTVMDFKRCEARLYLTFAIVRFCYSRLQYSREGTLTLRAMIRDQRSEIMELAFDYDMGREISAQYMDGVR